MESLLFSLNATVPIFAVMLVGMLLRRMKFVTEEFVSVCNKFVFKIALPAKLFIDMSALDMKEFDVGYVVFCFVITLGSILLIWLVAHCTIKQKESTGAFVQACYRSSAATLGIPFVENIYGNSGMIPLMMIGAVPLYNIFAVIVLTLENPELKGSLKQRLRKAMFGVVTNPIILGIFVGMFAAMLHVHLPAMATKTINYLGVTASPLAMIAIGASFDGKETIGKIKLTSIASFMKLVGIEILSLPIALHLGYSGQKLLALVIMLGSPSTSSGYIMAKNLGGDDVLSAGAIVLTTLFSSLTMTFWIFLIRYMGLL